MGLLVDEVGRGHSWLAEGLGGGGSWRQPSDQPTRLTGRESWVVVGQKFTIRKRLHAVDTFVDLCII